MAFKIPDRDIPKLTKLTKLNETELVDFHDALRQAAPSLSAVAFTAQVASRSKLDESLVTDLVRFFISLYWATVDQQLTPSATAEEVAKSATESGVPEPQVGWDSFKQHIRRLLSLHESLGIAAKAVFVGTQRECHFHTARVLTDARPIFGPDPAAQPMAFVLSHTLQLDVHSDGDDKELFIAMDADDLIQLRAAIDRAITKGKSLRAALAATAVPILGLE